MTLSSRITQDGRGAGLTVGWTNVKSQRSLELTHADADLETMDLRPSLPACVDAAPGVRLRATVADGRWQRLPTAARVESPEGARELRRVPGWVAVAAFPARETEETRIVSSTSTTEGARTPYQIGKSVVR